MYCVVMKRIIADTFVGKPEGLLRLTLECEADFSCFFLFLSMLEKQKVQQTPPIHPLSSSSYSCTVIPTFPLKTPNHPFQASNQPHSFPSHPFPKPPPSVSVPSLSLNHSFLPPHSRRSSRRSTRRRSRPQNLPPSRHPHPQPRPALILAIPSQIPILIDIPTLSRPDSRATTWNFVSSSSSSGGSGGAFLGLLPFLLALAVEFHFAG